MPSDIFEEALEIEIGLLEAGAPTLDSYPYPSLKPIGAVEQRTFQAVILENAYLRASFIPALGGRLLSLLDKRTQTEILSNGPLVPGVGGRRGASLTEGIQLHLDGSERLTSMAPVQFAVGEGDDDTPATLWMAEAVTGTGLSWHLQAKLPDDRAELILEARIFNRTLEEIPYGGGILLPPFETLLSDGDAFVGADQGQGVAVIPERGKWHGRQIELAPRSGTAISRFEKPRMLAPRQLDTWKVRILPFSGLSAVSAVSAAGALWVDNDSLQIQSASKLVDHKLVLLTGLGESLEAPATIFPEQLLEMRIPEGVGAVALLDPHKKVVLRWDGSWGPVRTGVTLNESPAASKAALGDSDLEDATFDIGARHIAHARLGVKALTDGDFLEADFRLEQALLYNGEDHLSWWMKAVGRRLRGDQVEEVAELLNAHYLAPLDPVLRAESFLSQGRVMGRDPSALLKSMDEFPENFIEVAALLVDARLYEQASVWIDEALRHADLPMLRYLLAYAYLQATTMQFEIAKQIAAASKEPISAPYHWRRIELEAIRALSARFPNDERLQRLIQIKGR